MAVRLPDFTAVGVDNVPPGDIRPQYMGASPEAAAQTQLAGGVESLGTGLQNLSTGVGHLHQQVNLVNAALAQANLHTELGKRELAINNEVDPAKIDALKAEMPKLLESAGQTIQDPGYRQLWMARHSTDVADAQLKADARQRAVYNDRFLSGAHQQAEGLLLKAQQTTDPATRDQAANDLTTIITSLVHAGVMSDTQAHDYGLRAQQSLITGHTQFLLANNMAPEALDYLSRNQKDVPAHMLAPLMHEAKIRSDKQTGEEFYQGLQGGGLPPGSAEPNAFLAQQRAGLKRELDQNPALKRRLAAIVDLENPDAGTAVAESLMNRAVMSGGSIASGIGGGAESFYNPVRQGVDVARQRQLEQSPERMAARMAQIDQALAGSNITRGHTDQGSRLDPNYQKGGIGVNIAGERFNDFAGWSGGLAGSRAFRQQQQEQAGVALPQQPLTLPQQFEAIRNSGMNPIAQQHAIAALEQGEAARRSAGRDQIATTKQLSRDNLLSIQQTGQPIPGTAERVYRDLGPDEGDRYLQEQTFEQSFYDQTKDFPELPALEMNRRLTQMAAGGAGQPGFEVRQRLYVQAEKKAQEIQKLRHTDPAAAVARDPDVVAASASYDPMRPVTWQPLVLARMKAMDKIGIPYDAQVPITTEEATALYRPIEAAATIGDAKGTQQALAKTIRFLQVGLGGEANKGLAKVLRVGSLDQDTRTTAFSALKKLGRSEMPTPEEGKAVDDVARAQATTDAMSGLAPFPSPGDFPVPDAEAIGMLRQKPESKEAFDASYGPGTADRILGIAPPILPRPKAAPAPSRPGTAAAAPMPPSGAAPAYDELAPENQPPIVPRSGQAGPVTGGP